MTIRTVAVGGLFGSIAAIGVAYAAAFLPGGLPPWAPMVMALAMTGAIVSTMALGAARRGSVGRLGWVFAFVMVVVGGGFVLVLSMPPVDPSNPTLWLGLPPRVALVLYGIGLVPLLVVPVAYAATFDAQTLSEADLERVREAALRNRGIREAEANGEAGAPETSAAGTGVER